MCGAPELFSLTFFVIVVVCVGDRVGGGLLHGEEVVVRVRAGAVEAVPVAVAHGLQRRRRGGGGGSVSRQSLEGEGGGGEVGAGAQVVVGQDILCSF